MEKVLFKDLFLFEKKSTIKAGGGLLLGEGKYPFYTSSNTLTKSIDNFQFDRESLIFGTGGMASIHICNVPFAVSTDCFVTQAYDLKKVFTKYVFYYLSGNIHLLENGFKGAGLKHISKDYLQKIEIPLPSLSEQKAIAQKLDKAQEIIHYNEKIIAQYDALTQSLFLDMFGDPVKNEKGWEKDLFKNIFESRLGKMLDKSKKNGFSKYKYLGNSNVKWFSISTENLLEMEFSDKDINTFRLKKGDLLICEGGEVGRCAVWHNDHENIFFQKALHRARLINKNEKVVFYERLFWFLAKRGGLKDFASESTIAHLTGEKLKEIPLIHPPIELQNQFAEHIAAIEVQKQMAQESLDQSKALFNSLFQQSFKS